MKRKMEPARPESKIKIKDPGMLAARPKPKKTEPDVYPTRKVPATGRPKGGGNAMSERLKNKRI